jgi:hypothetical protein
MLARGFTALDYLAIVAAEGPHDDIW